MVKKITVWIDLFMPSVKDRKRQIPSLGDQLVIYDKIKGYSSLSCTTKELSF